MLWVLRWSREVHVFNYDIQIWADHQSYSEPCFPIFPNFPDFSKTETQFWDSPTPQKSIFHPFKNCLKAFLYAEYPCCSHSDDLHMTCFEFPTLYVFSWIVHVFQMCWSKRSLSFFVVNMFFCETPSAVCGRSAVSCARLVVVGCSLMTCLFTSVTRQKCPKSFSCDGSCKLLIHTVTNFKAVLLWMFQLITLCCLRNNPSTPFRPRL